jgi:pSer/pThr/pTyr-binding forkhead associated (FHA) protein
MTQPQRPGSPNQPVVRTATLIEGDTGMVAPRPAAPPPANRSGTLVEADDEVREAQHALQTSLKLPQASLAASANHAEAASPARSHTATPFRPTARPPIAELTVFDDGKTDGEVIRIRDHRFVIGRVEGDLRIPLDGRISSRHVEITLQSVGGMYRWVITDLQSLHGLFVRATRAVLDDRGEFLVGNGRYRFDSPQTDRQSTANYVANELVPSSTCAWDEGPGPFRPPALTEVLGADIGNRVLLVKPEYWIGSDPGCPICRPDDPFCEPRHARLFRTAKGSWQVEHYKTQNGLWIRKPQIPVDSIVRFQVGEQRFQLRVQ